MNEPTSSPRVFRDAKAILAESIVWDPAGDLLWCDITAGLLHRSPVDGPADGSADTVISLEPPLASFHQAAAGGFVVSLGDRVVRVDDAGDVTETLSVIAHAEGEMRMNEGKVDPAGRWVTGSMVLATDDPVAAIYSLDAQGFLEVVRTGVGVANGFEWTLDGSSMYFTDTAAGTVYRGDYSADGELTAAEPLITGAPHDGLTIDEEGHLWSAVYGEGRVARYTPDGEEEFSIALPVPNITSVAFGGPDRSTLFVGSARENLSEEDLERHPLSGAIFSIETGTHGLSPRTFGSVER
jgi:sugar lactone lactonase YvrE